MVLSQIKLKSVQKKLVWNCQLQQKERVAQMC